MSSCPKQHDILGIYNPTKPPINCSYLKATSSKLAGERIEVVSTSEIEVRGPVMAETKMLAELTKMSVFYG